MRQHLRESRPDLVGGNQPPIQQTYNPKLNLHARPTQATIDKRNAVDEQFKERMQAHREEEEKVRAARKARKSGEPTSPDEEGATFTFEKAKAATNEQAIAKDEAERSAQMKAKAEAQPDIHSTLEERKAANAKALRESLQHLGSPKPKKEEP